MGQTNKKKIEAREARLKALPQSQRLLKSALIKKKEGRVLDASEKHALKMSSEHGEIIRLWEQLRQTNAEADNEAKSVAEIKSGAYEHKYPIVDKLMRLILPTFMNYARTPSVSRVLQSMVKYGSPAHIDQITKSIQADFVTCATDGYAHFVVMAVIRHATRDTFKNVLSAIIPAVPQLVTHKFGVHVIHSAYSSRWTTAADRDMLIMGIYKDNQAVMKRWEGFPVLEHVLSRNRSIQKRLLTRLFELVEKLISQKEAVGFPFVQRLALAFLKTGTREEVSELCDSLRPYLGDIAQTREGAPLASLTFSLTHPKKRKEILRTFKDNLGELSTGKYSAPVIARVLDLLYDIQLAKKYLVEDMSEHIGQIIGSEYGFRIIMHLLTPHESRKNRFLFPNWLEHNLYSVENENWNHHTWLTGDYEEEVVEVCGKPAMTSHLQHLPPLLHAFLAYATDEKNATRLNRRNAGLIAREVLRVTGEEPAYKIALGLKPKDVSLLQKLSPASGGKREHDEDGPVGADETEEVEEKAPPKKASKKEKSSAEVQTKKASKPTLKAKKQTKK